VGRQSRRAFIGDAIAAVGLVNLPPSKWAERSVAQTQRVRHADEGRSSTIDNIFLEPLTAAGQSKGPSEHVNSISFFDVVGHGGHRHSGRSAGAKFSLRATQGRSSSPQARAEPRRLDYCCHQDGRKWCTTHKGEVDLVAQERIDRPMAQNLRSVRRSVPRVFLSDQLERPNPGPIDLRTRRRRTMKRLLLTVVLSMVGASSLAFGQANEGDLIAYPIGELSASDSAGPTLIGGRPVKNPADWPANFYSTSASGSCTSTLVSETVLLLAAHCVGSGRKVTIEMPGKSYTGTCSHANEYAGNQTADYALCLMTEAVPVTAYERVNIVPTLLKVGVDLSLTGFGCTTTRGTGGNDGVYRIGEAPIQVLPAGTNNDIVTKGEVAVCYGDSGGPAYLLLEGSEDGSRLQVSINSRGNIYNTSYLSSLSTDMAVNFMRAWTEANNAKICGLNADAKGCHK
jgi:hypothetical protein